MFWAVFFEVDSHWYFSNINDIVSCAAIFFPVVFPEFPEFVSGHMPFVLSFPWGWIHIWHRGWLNYFWFHRGVFVNDTSNKCACIPCHFINIVEDLHHMEWCTNNIIQEFRLCKLFKASIMYNPWLLGRRKALSGKRPISWRMRSEHKYWTDNLLLFLKSQLRRIQTCIHTWH